MAAKTFAITELSRPRAAPTINPYAPRICRGRGPLLQYDRERHESVAAKDRSQYRKPIQLPLLPGSNTDSGRLTF